MTIIACYLIEKRIRFLPSENLRFCLRSNCLLFIMRLLMEPNIYYGSLLHVFYLGVLLRAVRNIMLVLLMMVIYLYFEVMLHLSLVVLRINLHVRLFPSFNTIFVFMSIIIPNLIVFQDWLFSLPSRYIIILFMIIY